MWNLNCLFCVDFKELFLAFAEGVFRRVFFDLYLDPVLDAVKDYRLFLLVQSYGWWGKSLHLAWHVLYPGGGGTPRLDLMGCAEEQGILFRYKL